MLNENRNRSFDAQSGPGISTGSQPSPLRLLAIDGAKKRGLRPGPSSPAFTTNGLHLVSGEVSVAKKPMWYTPPSFKAPVPSSGLRAANPILLRTMWVASLLCYAGVLVWFAN